MSDRRIRTFIFLETKSRAIVFSKRAIGIDLSLSIPDVQVFQIVSEKPPTLPKSFEFGYDPENGFVPLASALSGDELKRLTLLQRKIEVLTILNTNIQLLIAVLNERFTPAHADSIPVSAENRPLLRRFLDDERELLLRRCRAQLQTLCDSVMALRSVDEVQAFYKDFSDHTIVGDYSASNKGMI